MRLFFKKIAKDLAIECAAFGVAYASQAVLAKHDETSGVLSSSFSLRMYYLSKNIFYYFDAQYHQCDSKRAAYSAMFNSGVAAMLYPAAHYIGLATSLNRVAGCALVYAGGILTRSAVQIVHSHQSLPVYFTNNVGCITAGIAGIFFSAYKEAGIATPAFYWSGQLYDIYRKDLTIKNTLLNIQSTVGLQVLLAYLTKLALNLADKTSPIPGFELDTLIGIFHRVIVHSYSHDPSTLCNLQVILPTPPIRISAEKITLETHIMHGMRNNPTLFSHTPILPKISVTDVNASRNRLP